MHDEPAIARFSRMALPRIEAFGAETIAIDARRGAAQQIPLEFPIRRRWADGAV